MTAPATITETLAAHEFVGYKCRCGWENGDDDEPIVVVQWQIAAAHRAHLADVLLPVLAEVWDEGWANGEAAGAGYPCDPNPYRAGT